MSVTYPTSVPPLIPPSTVAADSFVNLLEVNTLIVEDISTEGVITAAEIFVVGNVAPSIPAKVTIGTIAKAGNLTLVPLGTGSNPVVAAGNLQIVPVTNSAGNFNATLSNLATLGQSTVYTLPDPVSATATVVTNTGLTTMAAGSQIILDKGTITATGTGPYVATLSKNSGVITTPSLTTAGGATSVLTLTNTKITTANVIGVFIMGGTNTTAGVQLSAVAGSNTATINITNTTAATAFNGTLIIGFVIF